MFKPKLSIIVQARMGSTRLPGKVLKPVRGRPLLAYQMERLNCVRNVDNIIIATSDKDEDYEIVELCQKMDWPFFRGSESDVLDRYYQTAKEFKSHSVARVTADCPLIDPEVVEAVINHFGTEGKWDYVSNTLERTYPRGMDTEVFSFKALKEAAEEAIHADEREHVTPFIFRNNTRYRISQKKQSMDLSHHRWTVDTPEDFELVKNVLSQLYPSNPGFTMDDVVSYLDQHPEVFALNRDVEQKKMDVSRQFGPFASQVHSMKD